MQKQLLQCKQLLFGAHYVLYRWQFSFVARAEYYRRHQHDITYTIYNRGNIRMLQAIIGNISMSRDELL